MRLQRLVVHRMTKLLSLCNVRQNKTKQKATSTTADSYTAVVEVEYRRIELTNGEIPLFQDRLFIE